MRRLQTWLVNDSDAKTRMAAEGLFVPREWKF